MTRTRSSVLRFAPVLLVVSVAVTLGWLVLGGLAGGDKYVVYAKFEDAGGILKNYAVKVGAVPAGSVEKISLDENDDVIVRMELDEGVGPIGTNATARVRPVNLLGEKYVDLDPGDAERPLPSGSTIPKTRTGTPTELDDVLNALEPNTRAGLRILINEAGLGLAGRGADFNAVLEQLPPALDEAGRFVGEVAAENETLDRLIQQANRVVGTLSLRRDQFGELIESAGDALDTVAARRAELGETVRNAPGGLGQLATTLTRLQGAADELTPAARDLRAASPALAATLAEAPAFADAAQPALDAVRRASPALSRLGRRSIPTLRRLRPTARRLARFTGGLQPLIDTADAGKGLREFLDFMDGWVGVIENADGLGHSFRLRLIFDEQFFTSGIQKYLAAMGGGPPAPRRAKRPPERSPSAPHSSPPAPSTPDKQPLRRLLDDLTDRLKKAPERGQRVPEELQQLLEDLPGQLLPPPSQPQSGGRAEQLLNYLLSP